MKNAGATKASQAAISANLIDTKKGTKTINIFMDDSAYANAYEYLASGNATTESAALFILGMGLHTQQDISAMQY